MQRGVPEPNEGAWLDARRGRGPTLMPGKTLPNQRSRCHHRNMGRLHFTRSEIDELRTLLGELRRAEPSRQKAIRTKMRQIGFYITDVSHAGDGFTCLTSTCLSAAERSPSGSRRTSERRER